MIDSCKHMGSVRRRLALRSVFVLQLFFMLIVGCSSKEPVTPAYAPGSLVTLGQPGETVSLWLMYEDRCSVDVVHNWVDGGSRVILTGQVCEDGGTVYYKVRVSSELRAQMEIQGDNLWVKERNISQAP